jgi:hypothetical protein
MTDVLEQTVARFRQRPNSGPSLEDARVSAAAFRASVQSRLAAVERDLREVKGRINGLIFVVAGAVITQLVLKVIS